MSSKLGRTEEAKNTLIAKVLTHLDQIDFQLDQAVSDVLGDAYQYLIGQFASGAGKKAGEFYTPQQMSTILARIVTTGKTRCSQPNIRHPQGRAMTIPGFTPERLAFSHVGSDLFQKAAFDHLVDRRLCRSSMQTL